MEFLWILARQPLFRLCGAVLVLLLVERNLWVGLGAAVVWSVWVAWSVGAVGGGGGGGGGTVKPLGAHVS